MTPVLVRKFVDDEPCIYFDDESWHDSDRSEVRRSRFGMWQRGGYDNYMSDDEWETLEGSDSLRLEAEYQRLVKAGEVEDIDAIPDRPEWISVSERLPEQGQRVLFFVNRKNTNYAAVYAGEYLKVFDVWAYDQASEKGWASAFVTHWMPVPASPTE
jgi:hypothetical protein